MTRGNQTHVESVTLKSGDCFLLRRPKIKPDKPRQVLPSKLRCGLGCILHNLFQMRKPDDKRYTVNAQAQILGAPTEGKVSYTWGANDLAVWGIYQIQWQVTFPDFKEITTKDPIYIEVRRQ